MKSEKVPFTAETFTMAYRASLGLPPVGDGWNLTREMLAEKRPACELAEEITKLKYTFGEKIGEE